MGTEPKSRKVTHDNIPPTATTDGSKHVSLEKDSDDNMELEIVGNKKQDSLPTVENNKKPTRNKLYLLDLADHYCLNLSPRKAAKFSRGRNMQARAKLLQQLLLKQKKMGNNRLPCKLWYKSQEDHFRDSLYEKVRYMRKTTLRTRIIFKETVCGKNYKQRNQKNLKT